MRPSDSGVGIIKTILVFVFLGIVAFVAIKLIPPYVGNYEVQDHIRELAIEAAAAPRPPSPDVLRNDVVDYAQKQGLPVTQDNVKVVVAGRITIDLDYTVPVDLKVYTFVYHFTPSAEGRPLI
jgi:hypothetical protein